jgi:hypothetical protein
VNFPFHPLENRVREVSYLKETEDSEAGGAG